ncbi:MAG: zf-HC2 domain-containing protein [Proteobacteria bacterium]|nr:zf-HC2 domain-containing protein [Pseudomonadota bacterium]
MNCHEATRTLSEEQERSLTLGEQVGLDVHLAVCPPCRSFRRQVAFLRESMQAYARRPNDDRDASQ